MPRRFKIFSRCEGAVAVEFAICLPLLMLLVAGICDFGWYYYWKNSLTNASLVGARYGVQANYLNGIRTPHTDAEIQNIVKQNYGSDLVVTVARTGINPGTPLSVTVEKTMVWFFWGVLHIWGIDLPTKASNKTTMTME